MRASARTIEVSHMARHLTVMIAGAVVLGALLVIAGLRVEVVVGWAPLLVCAAMMLAMGHGHTGRGSR